MAIDPQLINQLTLEEKATLVSGKDFWYTATIDRLNLSPLMMSDGPSGLRKQDAAMSGLGLKESIEAVCFPASALTACSFDRQEMNQLGHYLGKAAQAERVGVLLGPGINLKRSPLAGRNFEYFSEDPYLTGELATAYVNGVQNEGVGVSVKHFAANNRENERFTMSSNIDERTLRELYLSAFEKVVKNAHPATIMCSYNQINGTLNSQNHRLLTDILRNEWGFKGLVMSDWGAVADHTAAIKAGLDLEMPGKGDLSTEEIVAAVKKKQLSETTLDRAVSRVLAMIDHWQQQSGDPQKYDMDAQHQFARKLAAKSMVLMKNDHDILPISGADSIAVIGELAKKPRYQGSGSSHVNAHHLVTPFQAIDQARPQTPYAAGYSLNQDEVDHQLIDQAVTLAKRADKVLLFAGYPEQQESEGFDKDNLNLPQSQNQLIEAVAKVNPNTVVILQNGSVLLMPWVHQVAGILETYLAGEAVGEATWDILSGKVTPSGKLAESFPQRLEDTPSYLTFNADPKIENYREGGFVGYRYYDKKQLPVQFPFGFGLSYTSFDYHDLTVSVEGKQVLVSLKVRNTGQRQGEEIVQIYVGNHASHVEMAAKQLVDFGKVGLNPGEETQLSLTLGSRAFSWFNPATENWQVDNGSYEILIGSSSQNIRLHQDISLDWTPVQPLIVNMNTYINVLVDHPELKSALDESGIGEIFDKVMTSDPATAKMFLNMPLRAATTVSVTLEQIQRFVELSNS
ncbi:glycoside hydrolase family 3 C-terminal domain-containing protein [Lentilactobacillus diolivorans]|uniref:glycoside hydrolase family 3 C-terminal domain-containing protein n=1 Tax=Lentilactobacillus diolivorans TaxID=179838 RepID=UPI0024684DC5|nr:glycoside hydrolase family 3 C-terminal domain-containing protein [Lentilactobacillus diolivorans]MDH5106645.1 glycoside hydrolase family 3 C-terminal domain-containing protein [Lentilactobacillus diolivorans]